MCGIEYRFPNYFSILNFQNGIGIGNFWIGRVKAILYSYYKIFIEIPLLPVSGMLMIQLKHSGNLLDRHRWKPSKMKLIIVVPLLVFLQTFLKTRSVTCFFLLTHDMLTAVSSSGILANVFLRKQISFVQWNQAIEAKWPNFGCHFHL